jgi:hypothetical protein
VRGAWTHRLSIALGVAGLACGAADPPAATDAEETATGPAPAIRPAAGRPPVEDPEFFFQPAREDGRWRRFRTHRFDPSLDPAQRAMIERLEAIGYAAGSTELEARATVTLHRPERAFAGANFFVSGHAQEALLVDMQGETLHRWQADFWSIWPDYPVSPDHPMTRFFRRGHLYPNGDILVIWEGLGIARLDRDSQVVWAQPIRAHHDLEVLPSGEIYVLTREAHVLPEVDEREPVLEDFISVLGPDGEERERVSLLAALEASDLPEAIDWQRRPGDVFHTNSLHRLDGSIAHVNPAFAAGNVLVYLLALGVTAVVDLEAERVVWAERSPQIFKHDPKVLPNGNLLIFENRYRREPDASAVLEIDPKSGEVVWEHGAETGSFFSDTCGTADRLPNGNTLITESDGGRALEVAPDGEIVWEFYNPHRAGDEGQFIATLFELVRLPPDFPLHWLEPPWAP